MRAIIQRVASASVTVAEQLVGQINAGLLVLLAVSPSDSPDDLRKLADKILTLRIFPDDQDRFDRSLIDCHGELLVVSQFTLYADTRKGRRPSFVGAAAPALAEPMVEQFIAYCREQGITTASGQFGAAMQVHLINDGPVTIILDTAEWQHGRG
ncbi:D-aminoacyl-tRNA deacylase [Herpetosiphon geysericola]|uniref:D-aminoacyl-tRNA deacylase n=1 Tax=Herpetosiphon geysericola TaxID=70996 RepID=A0A0N8GPR2_9CHLR|nr:D-aminoacyl-tRNA deacylase [Herpetosiphon geysericola]KPL81610.1 D-tyrosyl-tRNA(Tyr) deacylase [Herpetosiphon geysericola]